MEVTDETYAWFISCGMIDGSKPIKLKNDQTVILTDSFIDNLLEGRIMQIPLIVLEEQYNKFYNLKLNYTEEVKDLTSGNSPQVRSSNWAIVAKILTNFGISLDEKTITDIVNGNIKSLSEVINTIKILSSELLKRSQTHANDGRLIAKKVKSTVNIENLSIKKDVESSESCLEFFILTLSRSLKMKPRQSAALLSNNRKYLVQIVNKGIKSDFSLILNWFEEVNLFKRHLIQLIKASKNDSLNMVYSIISVGLFSKNPEVCVQCISLLNNIFVELGNDWTWFSKDGIESAVFCSNKHPELREKILMFFDDFSLDKIEEMLNIFRSKLTEKELYDFILNMIDILPLVNRPFVDRFKIFIVEQYIDQSHSSSTENKNKFSEVSPSLLIDIWVLLGPLNDNHTELILKQLKNGIRDKSLSKIKRISCILELFRLFEILAQNKNNLAPTIYKNLVFIFLENYNILELRTTFLERFEFMFQGDTKIPIKILLDPYLKQLVSSKSYLFDDLKFVLNIINHPRYEFSFADDTYQFLCFVNLSNKSFSHLSSEKILELLEKRFIDERIVEILANFINKSIALFMESGDTLHLETPYEIVRMGNQYINNQLNQTITEAVIISREKTGKLSSGLLSLLWFFDFHDDLLMILDEKYAERYESQEKLIKRQKELLFKQTPEYQIEKIKKRKVKEIINQRQEEAKSIIRENKIKKTLKKQLEQRSIELGSSTIFTTNPDIPKTSVIKHEGYVDSRKEIDKDKFSFIRLEAEEPREKKAIENLAIKYRKNLKYYYRQYVDNAQNLISRNSFLKMLREFGVNQEILSVDEISYLIRQHFGLPATYFTYDQFIELAYHTAYLVFSKIKPSNSISENFEVLCKLMELRGRNEDKYLLKKVAEFMKANTNALLPPGFKYKKTTNVKFESKIPDFLKKQLGESKSIVIEILDNLLSKIFNSHIIESFVKVSQDLELRQTEKPNWCLGTFLAYAKMEKKEVIDNNIIEVGNLIEDIMFNLEHNHKNLNFVHTIIAKQEQEFEDYHKVYLKKDKKKWHAKSEELKEKLKKLKEKNKDKLTKKEDEKRRELMHEEEKYKLEYLSRMNHVKKTRILVETNKIKVEAERKLKIENMLKKEKEAEKKKTEEINQYIKSVKKKLKEQFIHVKDDKAKTSLIPSKSITSLPPLKNPIENIFKKNKNYIDFEKNLYSNMQNLLNRKDIKEVLSEYQSHLITIYEIYTQMGNNKISFYNHDAIHYKEFRQFCSDFNLLGILINVEQLHYIFHKSATTNQGEKEEQNFLKFNDFLVAFMMLTLYSKYTNKSRKLIPDDVKKLNQQEFKSFIHYVGFELPFSRKNLEDYINDRRKLTAKEEIRLKRNINEEAKSINEKLKNEKYKHFPLPKKLKEEPSQFEKENSKFNEKKEQATEDMRHYFDNRYKDIKKKDLRSPKKEKEKDPKQKEEKTVKDDKNVKKDEKTVKDDKTLKKEETKSKK